MFKALPGWQSYVLYAAAEPYGGSGWAASQSASSTATGSAGPAGYR